MRFHKASPLLLRGVLINTVISGAMIGGSLHYVGKKHHKTFHKFYLEHRKENKSPFSVGRYPPLPPNDLLPFPMDEKKSPEETS